MNIYFDFPFFLTALVFSAGVVSFCDIVFFAAKRKQTEQKMPWYTDYARSFFPVLLVVWVMRSFIVQPYRVPTGSLEPTILPGDFIVVNQFAYGLRTPVMNLKIKEIGAPKIGDIALFRWPKDPATIFVKRVIGTPGDRVVYKGKVLSINGKKLEQASEGLDLDVESGYAVPVERKVEKLPSGALHAIFLRDTSANDDFDITVPAGHYFMMGDNRDDSDDSRSWGFVPEKNLIGKAFGVWMSWDSKLNAVRWKRIGKAVR